MKEYRTIAQEGNNTIRSVWFPSLAQARAKVDQYSSMLNDAIISIYDGEGQLVEVCSSKPYEKGAKE